MVDSGVGWRLGCGQESQHRRREHNSMGSKAEHLVFTTLLHYDLPPQPPSINSKKTMNPPSTRSVASLYSQPHSVGISGVYVCTCNC